MSTKQLYEKTSEGMKEVSPLVAIEDIYSKLSDTPLEALVSLYNHVKCEWKGSVADTRRTVPLFLRRSGLFITYNNGTKYITEFFSAGTDQITTEGWVKDSNWTSVPDEDYISAGVKPGFGTIGYEQLSYNLKQLFREKVNVTNFPDDEDIASVDNMLKFKNREVNAVNFQSKGYVILRKNLRLVNGVVKNILTQNMINQPNTIYEIRYDFDLNGETIEVPDGCTLKFEGGILKNGKLEGKYTRIFAHITKIVKNIIFSGTWDIQKVYTEWFDEENDSKSLQSAIIAAELFLSPIYLTKNEYHIQNVIFLFNTRIIGKNKIINGDNGTIFISGYLENGKVFTNLDESNGIDGNPTHYVSNCLFDEISFENYKVGIKAKGFTVRSVIRNCQFNSNKGTYSVDISHCWNMLFEKNTVINSITRFVDFVDWTSIRNNAFECYLRDDSYDSIGLLIEAGSYSSIISNNGFHGFKRALVMTGYKFNTVITSNHFEVNGTCIDLDNNVGQNIRIENNWIKPNSSVYSELTAMRIGYMKNSWIGNNISDISSNFAHYLVLGNDCDNNIFVGIKPEQIESYFNSNILINTDCKRVDDVLKGYARLSITDVRGGNALDTEKSQSMAINTINGFKIKIEGNDTIIISDNINVKSLNGLISFPYVLLLNLQIFSDIFWYIQAIVNTGKITVLSNYREDSFNSTEYIDINLEKVDGKLAIRLKNITGAISGTIKKL